MSIKNARTLGVRLDEKDAALLKKYEDETAQEGVGLARGALKAALRYYEQHGYIAVPMTIVPEKSNREDDPIPSYFREDEKPYPAPPKKKAAS